jgi:hypothetical protein
MVFHTDLRALYTVTNTRKSVTTPSLLETHFSNAILLSAFRNNIYPPYLVKQVRVQTEKMEREVRVSTPAF